MRIEQWWLSLTPATRQWLIDNNGDAVPPEIVTEIIEVGGTVSSDEEGVFALSDAEIDWVEAVANAE